MIAMKRKQMQLADSRLVLSSGAKLAHCHGQPVGRLILRPRRKLWIGCATLDTLIEHAHTISDGAARLLDDGVQQPAKCLVVATVDDLVDARQRFQRIAGKPD